MTITVADLLAGHATMTAQNAAGDHVTFRVNGGGVAPGARFVSVMTGPDNEKMYTYLGMLDRAMEHHSVRLTRGSQMTYADRRARVVEWAIRLILLQLPMPEGYTVRPAGKCFACGRKITNPVSLDMKYGPECLRRLEKAT